MSKESATRNRPGGLSREERRARFLNAVDKAKALMEARLLGPAQAPNITVKIH